MEPALRPWDMAAVGAAAIRSPLAFRPGQVVIAHHPNRPGCCCMKRAARCEPDGWFLSSARTIRSGRVGRRQFGLVSPEASWAGAFSYYRRADYRLKQ